MEAANFIRGRRGIREAMAAERAALNCLREGGSWSNLETDLEEMACND